MSGRTMNYNNYYKSLESMCEPIMPSQLPDCKMHINDLVEYARNKGKKVKELSPNEIRKFIKL